MNEKKYNNNWVELIWLSELFSRYYEGRASEKEKQVVERWEAEKEHQPDLRLLTPDEETDKIWRNLSHQLHLTKTPKRISKPFYRYAAAASVAILLGLGLYLTLLPNPLRNTTTDQVIADHKTYFETKTGEKKKMILPDGSVVYLNSDTKVAIVENQYGKQKREFWLEQGEAFFEVAKDSTKAFIIHSQELQTTVLGTSFNIKAYKELEERVVSVREGKVRVNKNDKVLGVLTRNKQIVYNKISQDFEENTTNWENDAGWIEGRLIMHNATIKELQLRLRQHFGVEVTVEKNAFNDEKRLNTFFPANASLTEVLDAISGLYGVTYKIEKQGKVTITQKKSE